MAFRGFIIAALIAIPLWIVIVLVSSVLSELALKLP